MDMRPQNPRTPCSPQGMSPPWKARVEAVSLRSLALPQLFRVAEAVPAAPELSSVLDSQPCVTQAEQQCPERRQTLSSPCWGLMEQRVKVLRAGCSPTQLLLIAGPQSRLEAVHGPNGAGRGRSRGWRSQTGSPCPWNPGKEHTQPAPASPPPPPPPHEGPSPGDMSLTLDSQHSPRAAAMPFFPPGQMELLKAMGVTGPLQPGQGASPAPHGHPAPLDPLPTGHGMDVCPLRCTMPGGNELFQTTFSGRDGPGSQARRWQPWPLSSPSLPPTLLPSSPPLRLNDFHMGLWQAEPSLPALSEISKFRRNMKIVKRPFLRG